MSYDKKSLLIFGGSFDPPHKIHFEMISQANIFLKPEKIIIVPTLLSPFKKTHFASFKDRKKMIESGIKEKKIKGKIEISDFEYEMGRKTYTYEVIAHYSKKYSGYKIYLLIGSDLLENFNKWKRHKTILKKANLITAIRSGFNHKNKFNAIFLKKIFPNISSTNIRKDILSLNFSKVPYSVKKYILKNNLYFTDILRKVKLKQTKERFKHTKGVVRLSYELALKHNVDMKKAVIAAILHDYTRDFSIEGHRRIIKRYKFKLKAIDKVFKHSPQILHQFTSYLKAKHIFKIKDADVIEAIKWHSVSEKKRSKLDKLLFVSDFSSYDRNFLEASKVRKIAFQNLDKAYKLAKFYKEKDLKERGLPIWRNFF